MARSGMAGSGEARQAWRGTAGTARRGWDGLGQARQGEAGMDNMIDRIRDLRKENYLLWANLLHMADDNIKIGHESAMLRISDKTLIISEAMNRNQLEAGTILLKIATNDIHIAFETIKYVTLRNEHNDKNSGQRS